MQKGKRPEAAGTNLIAEGRLQIEYLRMGEKVEGRPD
jgi:hypothetical protein